MYKFAFFSGEEWNSHIAYVSLTTIKSHLSWTCSCTIESKTKLIIKVLLYIIHVNLICVTYTYWHTTKTQFINTPYNGPWASSPVLRFYHDWRMRNPHSIFRWFHWQHSQWEKKSSTAIIALLLKNFEYS